ncbi:hypothetical protein E8E11_002600 [Didymella keratinophila]|nr:hypothetical protein E8E11_002600 [Didymella keratinophila]
MASLFDLPPETRNNIYGWLLTDSSTNLTTLTASRLLHEEAASYFYQNTDVDISLMDVATSHATILPPFPERYLKYPRVLTVDVRLGHGSVRIREQAKRLTAMADYCTSLTSLTLSFASTASTVVSSTLDEYVLHASHPLTLALRHLLSSGPTRSVRVNLERVWFAPGILDQLMSKRNLKVSTTESSIERPMYGQENEDHLHELGLGSQEIEDTEDLHSEDFDGAFPSMPSSLNTALSELDYFSPTQHLDNIPDFADDEHSKPSSDEMMFDVDVLDEGSEEELTEDDDIDDDEEMEEIEEIDDIENIVDNLVQVHQQRLTDEDICYMTNFAPNMLRVWSKSLS